MNYLVTTLNIVNDNYCISINLITSVQSMDNYNYIQTFLKEWTKHPAQWNTVCNYSVSVNYLIRALFSATLDPSVHCLPTVSCAIIKTIACFLIIYTTCNLFTFITIPLCLSKVLVRSIYGASMMAPFLMVFLLISHLFLL